MGKIERAYFWLRHRLGLNSGGVTAEWRGDELWVGFACECGEIHDWHRAATEVELEQLADKLAEHR